MNDFVGLGVLPGMAAIFGLFVGGPVGGFVGLFAGVVIGTAVVFTRNSQQERVDELEREVASLQRQLDDGDNSNDAEVGGTTATTVPRATSTARANDRFLRDDGRPARN